MCGRGPAAERQQWKTHSWPWCRPLFCIFPRKEGPAEQGQKNRAGLHAGQEDSGWEGQPGALQDAGHRGCVLELHAVPAITNAVRGLVDVDTVDGGHL